MRNSGMGLSGLDLEGSGLPGLNPSTPPPPAAADRALWTQVSGWHIGSSWAMLVTKNCLE